MIEEMPAGVGVWKSHRDFAILFCTHDGAHHVRLPNGDLMCSFCKATEDRTEGFQKRVLVFAKLSPKLSSSSQVALF